MHISTSSRIRAYLKMWGIILFLGAVCLSSCTSQRKKEASQVQVSLYDTYALKKADALVLDAFTSSDIVILGENHFIKEQVLFVSNLIPQLYENGIYTLYSEFTYLEDAKWVNILINGDSFDEELAKNLLVRSGWDWFYKEYMELYRSAWALNKSIKKGRKFQIKGLELGRDFTAIQSPEDWKKSENRMAFFKETEKDWADRIISETVEKGEKALVYCGYNHGLTFYRQPIISNNAFLRLAGTERVGQHLFETLKDNCKYILLHAAWEPKFNDTPPVNPLHGKLDQLSDSLPTPYSTYGFYTKESLLGKIVDTTSFFSWGYPDFKLTDLCDGYIVIKPACELNLCEFIPNFIDSTTIEIARPQVRAWEDIQDISIQEANRLLTNGYKEQLLDFQKDKKKLNCR